MKNKKIDLENFDDLDIDSELNDLDFSFGEVKKPKNNREAVLQSLKDTKDGVKDEFKINSDNVKKFLEASVPSSIRTEFMDIKDLITGEDGVTSTVKQSMNEIKKPLKTFTSVLKTIAPRDGKIAKAIEKIDEKLGLQETTLKDEIKNSNDKLLEGLKAELSESFTKGSTLALMQRQEQRKQFKSNLDVLTNIANTLSVNKTFNIEISNTYYRKSLELQYKQLHTSREQLEVLKSGFELIKSQNENIIKNTGLPDFVKVHTSEKFKDVMTGNLANNVQQFLFKDISVIKRLKDNLNRRIKYQMENFAQGLSSGVGLLEAGRSGLDMMNSAEEMGFTKSRFAGNMIGGMVRDFFAKNVGERLANTKLGKKGVFNIKNIMADPGGWAGDQLDKLNKQPTPNSKLGAYRNKLLKMGYGLLQDVGNVGSDYTGMNIGRADPRDVAVFNNATQTSIVKVIPGLLSKIYGEIKSSRDGSDPASNELVFDYKRQQLVTKKQFKKNFKSDLALKTKTFTGNDLRRITDYYKEYGDFKEEELNVIGSTIITYLLGYGVRLNPSMLVSTQYIDLFPASLKEKVLDAGNKILEACLDAPYITSDIISALAGVRSRLPNLTEEIEEMFIAGHSDIAMDLGLATRDTIYNTYSLNRANVLETISRSGGYKKSRSKGNNNIPGMGGSNVNIKNTPNNNNSTVDTGTRSEENKKSVIDSIIKNIDGTVKSVEDLRAEFYSSVEYKTGEVKDFVTWVESNVGIDKAKEVIDAVTKQSGLSRSKKVKNWINKKIIEQKRVAKEAQAIEDEAMDILIGGGKNKKTLEDLRAEFYSSEEYKTGDVRDLSEWLAGQGLNRDGSNNTQLSRFRRLLQFTWSIDRKLAKMLLKYPAKLGWKAAKLGVKTPFKAAKFAAPKILKGAGIVASALPLQMVNALFGTNYTPGIPTWGADRTIVKKSGKGIKGLGVGLRRGLKFRNKFFNTVSRPFNWLFRAGEEAGVSDDTKTILAGLDELNNNLEDLKPSNQKKNPFDRDGDGLREGDWRSRLKLFKSNKDKKEKNSDVEKKKGVVEFMKDHKGLTIMGGIMLATGLLKSIGVSLDDVVSGVKTIASGVGSIFSGIRWMGNKIGSAISGIASFFGIKKSTKDLSAEDRYMFSRNHTKQYINGVLVKDNLSYKDENGKPIDPKYIKDGKLTDQYFIDQKGYDDPNNSKFDSAANAFGTVAAGGAALYGIRHPVKSGKALYGAGKALYKGGKAAVSIGKKIIESVLKYLKGSYIPGTGMVADAIESNEKTIVSKIDKTAGSFEKIKKIFNKLANITKNKKLLKKIGTKAAFKAAAKIGVYAAAAATGLGAVLTAGGILWDLGWTLYYMWDKDLTFGQAFSYQMLGTTLSEEDLSDSGESGEGAGVADVEAETPADDTAVNKDVSVQSAPKSTTVSIPSTGNSSANTVQKSSTPVQGKATTYTVTRPSNTTSSKKSGGGEPHSPQSSKAAGIIAQTSATRSQGKCATGVRTALEKAGYPSPKKLGFNVASAYMYAKEQIDGKTPLEGLGFSRLNVDPVNYTPTDGDIAVIDKGPMSNARHGHIAMYSSSKNAWISDFVQPDKNDPSPYGKKGLKANVNPGAYRNYVSIWRDLGGTKPMQPNPEGGKPTDEEMPEQESDGIISKAWNGVKSFFGFGDDEKQETQTATAQAAAPQTTSDPAKVTTPTPTIQAGDNRMPGGGDQYRQLSVISETLTKSLRVQMSMAESLAKLANNSGGLGNGDGKTPNNQLESPINKKPVIGLDRGQYV